MQAIIVYVIIYFYVFNWPLFLLLWGAYKKYLMYFILINYIWYTSSYTWKESKKHYLKTRGIDYAEAMAWIRKEIKENYRDSKELIFILLDLSDLWFDPEEFYNRSIDIMIYDCLMWDGDWCLIKLEYMEEVEGYWYY